MALHECECRADTDTLAAAEGDIGVPGQGFLPLRVGPTVRVEGVGIREILCLPVQEVRTEKDDGPIRNPVAAKSRVALRLAGDDIGRGIEPHRFLEHLKAEGEAVEVGMGRRAAAEGRGGFGTDARVDVGVAREEIPGPDQRVRRGLVSGQEESHRLVANLPILHRVTVLLLRREHQHREQIAGVTTGNAPFGNQAMDHRIQVDQCLSHIPLPGRDVRERQPKGRADDVGKIVQQGGEVVPDGVGLVAGMVGVEQGLADDTERQTRHLTRQIDGLSLRPPRLRDFRGMGHRVGVARDPPVRESGGDHAALTPVETLLARQETVAKERTAVHGERRTFVKRIIAGEEQFRNQRRVVDEDTPPAKKSERGQRLGRARRGPIA